ncbi:hypothetical protein SLEP1_g28935 [Rubroshorea leprosula]|uniref:Uncharacterized protein n=1 Tax=Rubroshorea leprosula TaxID=152421 RepID=A0AAV5K2D3_9ROSI|nr:hypothetical protein SLEP1_g28935 [Rubroshorea leprosula]
MSISKELYPSQEDLPYEEILRNPFSLKLWWRYLIAKSEAPFSNRFIIYEAHLKLFLVATSYGMRICENALKLLEIYPLLIPSMTPLTIRLKELLLQCTRCPGYG